MALQRSSSHQRNSAGTAALPAMAIVEGALGQNRWPPVSSTTQHFMAMNWSPHHPLWECRLRHGLYHLAADMLSSHLQVPGLVNVDFADVRAIMMGAGSSLMGQGRASGRTRAKDAALAAISSPLLDVGIERATGIVWNITGPPDLTLFEVLSAVFQDHLYAHSCRLPHQLPSLGEHKLPLCSCGTFTRVPGEEVR